MLDELEQDTHVRGDPRRLGYKKLVELDEYPVGEGVEKEHYWYTGWNTYYQVVFAGFLWAARFLAKKIQFYLASASVPAEVLNAIITAKKLIGREKPWWIFLSIMVPLLAIIGTVIIFDLTKFGVITAGPLAAIAGAGPFIFTGVLATFGFLNLLRTIGTAKECYAAWKNHSLTYLHKVRLASRITKTVALFALAGMIAPFMIATVANPFGAIFFAVAMTAVLATVITMKIWKTVQENRAWRKILLELEDNQNEDPYEVLGVDREYLNKLVVDKNRTTGLVKLKNMFLKVFGSEEVKAELKKRETPSSYVQKCLAKKIEAANGDVNEIQKLSRYAELIRKQRGRDMYFERVCQKAIKDLGPRDPYEYLGTTKAEVEKILTKEGQPGFFVRKFGNPPESEAVNVFLKEKLIAALNDKDPEEQKLVRRVHEMLSTRDGREGYEKYIAAKNKAAKPEQSMPIRDVERSDDEFVSSGPGLGWTFGARSAVSGSGNPVNGQSSTFTFV